MIERYSTLGGSMSFSSCNRESSTKHRLYFGGDLTDVEVPKFDPSQLSCISLPEREQRIHKVLQKAQTQPTPKLPMETYKHSHLY